MIVSSLKLVAVHLPIHAQKRCNLPNVFLKYLLITFVFFFVEEEQSFDDQQASNVFFNNIQRYLKFLYIYCCHYHSKYRTNFNQCRLQSRLVFSCSSCRYSWTPYVTPLLVFCVCRRRWCGGWNDPCNPDAKVSYAKCCDDMRCVCGILWKQGKCQCKSPSLFGR